MRKNNFEYKLCVGSFDHAGLERKVKQARLLQCSVISQYIAMPMIVRLGFKLIPGVSSIRPAHGLYQPAYHKIFKSQHSTARDAAPSFASNTTSRACSPIRSEGHSSTDHIKNAIVRRKSQVAVEPDKKF